MGSFIAVKRSWIERRKMQLHLNILWRMFVRNPRNSWMNTYKHRATHFIKGRRITFEERI